MVQEPLHMAQGSFLVRLMYRPVPLQSGQVTVGAGAGAAL